MIFLYFSFREHYLCASCTRSFKVSITFTVVKSQQKDKYILTEAEVPVISVAEGQQPLRGTLQPLNIYRLNYWWITALFKMEEACIILGRNWYIVSLLDIILNKMQSNFNPAPVSKLYGNDYKTDQLNWMYWIKKK